MNVRLDEEPFAELSNLFNHYQCINNLKGEKIS